MVETEPGSIGGGLMRVPEGVAPYVTIYVEVVDLEASLRAAEELGGKRITDPMPIPGFGAFAMLTDPDGAGIGLFKPES